MTRTPSSAQPAPRAKEEIMKRSLWLALILSVCLSALAQQKPKPAASPAAPAAPAPNPALPTAEVVDSFLRHYFGWDPNVQWQVGKITMTSAGVPEVVVAVTNPQGQQTLRLYITPDGRHAISGDMVSFGADPFARIRELLSKGNGVARGPADSPLTIVEFSDLQCSTCKNAQPIIDKVLADHPNARFVFQNFPLPMHDWAVKAAQWAECAGRQNAGAFWKWVPSVYAAQGEITLETADQRLGTLLATAGGDVRVVEACVAQPDTNARVQESLRLGVAVDVGGTPTVFVNGRKIANIIGTPYQALDMIIKYQAGQK